MPAVANLAVSVTARVSKLLKGFARARASMVRFAGSVRRMAGRVAKMAGIVGAFAVGGLVLLVKRANTAIDAISKLSDRLGIATEELGALHHAANIMGSDAAGIDKALEQMVRRLGEATTGIGESFDALGLLGLEANKLAAMPMADAFREIIRTIRDLPSVAQRADAAYSLFGRQGVKMLNIINLTDEAFENLMAEADALGLTFDRVAGAKVEAANDAFTRLKALLTGIGRTVAIEVAPFISTMVEGLVAAATAGSGMGRTVSRAIEWVVVSVATLADWLELLKAGWHAMRIAAVAVLGGIAEAVNLLAQSVNSLLLALGIEVAEGMAELTALIAEDLAAQLVESIDAMGEAWDNFNNQVNRTAAAEVFKEIRDAAEEAAMAVAKAGEEANKAGELLDWEAMFKAFRERNKATRSTAQTMTFGAGAFSPHIVQPRGVALGRETINVNGMDDLLTETRRQTTAIEDFSVRAD